MIRQMIERNLAQADGHVAKQVHIDRQAQTIAKMQRAGSDTALAEELLATMTTSQSHHEKHRDRLLKLLG